MSASSAVVATPN